MNARKPSQRPSRAIPEVTSEQTRALLTKAAKTIIAHHKTCAYEDTSNEVNLFGLVDELQAWLDATVDCQPCGCPRYGHWSRCQENPCVNCKQPSRACRCARGPVRMALL